MEKAPVGACDAPLPTQHLAVHPNVVLRSFIFALGECRAYGARVASCTQDGGSEVVSGLLQRDAVYWRNKTVHLHDAGASDRPVNDIKINNVTIHANPLAA